MSATEPPARPSKLLASSLIVSSMTMLSRVLGLLRDVVFARFIGAEAGADAFLIAFKIPNFLRRLFAEGAFAQAFVPVLSEYRQQGSTAAVKILIDKVTGCLGISLLGLTLLAVVGAPGITLLFAPGFHDNPLKFDLTSELIRITFPYLALISLTGLAGAILNSYNRFAVPAFTPALLNVALITAALFISPYFEQPVFALAWGVLAAGIIQLLFQLPFLMRIGLLPHPKVDWQDPGVRKVLGLMAPAIFGVSVSQINLLLDTVIASFLPTGSVSWLYYSDRLVELPLGVFGVGVATVILPSLSRQFSARSSEHFSATLDWALKVIVIIALPATLALMMLAEPILYTLFYYGKMTAHSIEMSTYSLKAYAIGLMAFMLIKVLAPGYFARQDMKTPVKIGIKAMVANMVFNIALVVPLYFYFNLGHVGLALATVLSAMLNAFLLYSGLRKAHIYQPQPGWKILSLRLCLASLAMVATIAWLLNQFTLWAQWPWQQRAYTLAMICVAGGGIYVFSLWLVGCRIKDFKSP